MQAFLEPACHVALLTGTKDDLTSDGWIPLALMLRARHSGPEITCGARIYLCIKSAIGLSSFTAQSQEPSHASLRCSELEKILRRISMGIQMHRQRECQKLCIHPVR